MSLQELIRMDKLQCRFTNAAPYGHGNDKQYFLSLIQADWSLRLELVAHPSKNISLTIRGIPKQANEANSHNNFNSNDVASIPLTKRFIQVDTLLPHKCLEYHQHPFGLIVFSHRQLSTEKYASLVNSIMPAILSNFLHLYDHTVDSIKPFLAKQSSENSRNKPMFPPPASGNMFGQDNTTYSNLTGIFTLNFFILLNF